MKKVASLICISLGLAACSSDLPPIEGCDAVGDIRPVCGMKTPEDIAALADGRHLLLSNFGGMHDSTGSLSLFDTETEALTPLFPPQSGTIETSGAHWGQTDCPAPALDKFSPHGTHLHQLADGRWRYLVVNHGGRESIEMFELSVAGNNISLAWRGCVLAAEETYMNDVVGLANGDLIFSRMLHHGGDMELLKATLGFATGDLWRWNKATGLRILPGTEAAQPNGLEISADERFVFANMYSEKQVWKVDAETGEKLASANIASADNSAWGTDGKLWIATHTGNLGEMMLCLKQQTQTCAAPFEIIALDPDTMETSVVFAHRGAPMGAATIAVPQGDRVYMGSFTGDRMISVAISAPTISTGLALPSAEALAPRTNGSQ